MQIQVLLFGITRDIVDQNQLKLEVQSGTTTDDVRNILQKEYPDLAKYQYALAVNERYADEGLELKNEDQVALIPPVSGG